jgi:hypothetical protein
LGQGVTIPFDVTQSPNVTTTDAVIDLLSPVSVPQKLFGSDDLNAVVDLSSPDSKPTSTLIAVKLDEMMVDLAINEDKPEELPVDTDDISKPTQFDETIHTDEESNITIKKRKIFHSLLLSKFTSNFQRRTSLAIY